ncbi:MAG TPA: DUF4160 domain-containing protein [Aldersonia sp.]
MPRLSEFYGIVIYMYWADHRPPHVHGIYAGDEALVRIEDGSVLRGELPRTARRLLREWVLLHRDELMANWERAQAGEPLDPVEPLR